MGTKLTAYMLTRNNEKTIDAALQSVSWLKCDIMVGDMGSSDQIAQICKKHKAKIVPIHFQDDFSRAKNKLLAASDSLWKLYIEPWEQMVTGHKAILEATEGTQPRAYCLQILQGQSITKEVRLWNNNLKFSNPVFESVANNKATLLSPVVIHTQGGIDEEEAERLLNIWKKADPLSEEVYYYQAYQFLKKKQYREFADLAEQYSSTNKKGMSAIMIRYHLATVNLYSLGDHNKALRNILECIAARPLMAEFWCLLGDLYYKTNAYDKAMSFYENAVMLGGERPQDNWPIEITKYGEHPQKMIASCQEILKHTKVFASK